MAFEKHAYFRDVPVCSSDDLLPVYVSPIPEKMGVSEIDALM